MVFIFGWCCLLIHRCVLTIEYLTLIEMNEEQFKRSPFDSHYCTAFRVISKFILSVSRTFCNVQFSNVDMFICLQCGWLTNMHMVIYFTSHNASCTETMDIPNLDISSTSIVSFFWQYMLGCFRLYYGRRTTLWGSWVRKDPRCVWAC